MGRLIVCPLSRLEHTVAKSDAGAIVSLLSPPRLPPRFERIAPGRHLILGLSDITAPQEGHVLAGREQIEILLAFIRAWDRSRPLVIHCYAGVSRSPAAAFIAACALTPDREIDIAQYLRRQSPTATPNPHLVALADSLLSREGRMVAAIDSIGRGAECFEGEIFCMDLA